MTQTATSALHYTRLQPLSLKVRERVLFLRVFVVVLFVLFAVVFVLFAMVLFVKQNGDSALLDRNHVVFMCRITQSLK